MKKKTREYVGWVGFTSGGLHRFRDESYYGGVLQADFFLTKREALKCYSDVRRATIVVETSK